MCSHDEESVCVVRVSISTLISGGRKNWVGCFEVAIYIVHLQVLQVAKHPGFLSLWAHVHGYREVSHHTLVSFRSAWSELAAACSTVGSSRLSCLRLLLSSCQSLVAQVMWLWKKTNLMKTKDMAPLWSWDKKKQWRTPRLHFALPRASQASFVVPTAYAGTLKLTGGFRNFENERIGKPRKVELFYDGKTFNSERAVARVMPYGKGNDVILTIPDFDFQVSKRLTINEPKFRGPVGELPRARRYRSVAPRYACGR